MKVAIIGAGISGLMVAEQLQGVCDYTLFEQADYLGGHSNTHEVIVRGKSYHVDTGFIVCNRAVYKNFFAMLDKYHIATQASNMSFAVNNLASDLVYNATNVRSLFCQKRNLFNPKFYRMIRDIFRFYAEAEQCLNSDTEITLGDFLQQNGYGQYFIDEHIVPMASALWSADFDSIKGFPLRYLLSFMHNHQMLQINHRPMWETVKGGSSHYVKVLCENLTGTLLTNTLVLSVAREHNKVMIKTPNDDFAFDYVFFATHSNQTLKMLEQPTPTEIEVLSNIPYVKNSIDLHTDASIMPKQKKAWASWVVNKYPQSESSRKNQCTVNYYMNLLQNIDCPEPLIVSLNQSEHIDEDKKLKTLHYHHPVYSLKTIAAQKRKDEIQGINNSYFCGAYWGWGFHEDGASSAVDAVSAFKQRVLQQ